MNTLILVCVSTSVVYLLVHVYELYRPVLPVSRVAADQEELAVIFKKHIFYFGKIIKKTILFLTPAVLLPHPLRATLPEDAPAVPGAGLAAVAVGGGLQAGDAPGVYKCIFRKKSQFLNCCFYFSHLPLLPLAPLHLGNALPEQSESLLHFLPRK